MQFDLTKTLALIKGGLLDHENTWKTYLEECPDWQQTALVLTVPLFTLNVLLSLIFSRLTGGYAIYGHQGGWFTALIISLVMGAIGFALVVFVFNFMAGVFKGAANFSRAFAAVSLALIPAWVAGALAGLIPYLGVLIALAGGIMSLVFLYRIMPMALGIAEDKRVIHYVVSLVIVLVCNMVIGLTIGVSTQNRISGYSVDDKAGSRTANSGMMGEIARQTDLMDAASADEYEPPSDGKLDKDQVEDYVSVLRKTRAVHAEYEEKMEKLAAEMKAKEDAGESLSMADMGKMYSGVGGLMGANNAEMEVVKTGGGNWSEHEWVKQQLRTAHIQQGEGSDANAHNYKLYEKYEEELDDG